MWSCSEVLWEQENLVKSLLQEKHWQHSFEKAKGTWKAACIYNCLSICFK